jgi:hypothetical protein
VVNLDSRSLALNLKLKSIFLIELLSVHIPTIFWGDRASFENEIVVVQLAGANGTGYRGFESRQAERC